MYNLEATRILRQKKCAWFKTPLGSRLRIAECGSLKEMVRDLHMPVVLQIGGVDEYCAINIPENSTQIRIDVDSSDESGSNFVTAEPEALPFATQAANLVILPHTLEYALDPHELLREASRVLIADGHLVLIGFNPMGLWGLWRLMLKWQGQMPWCGQFFGLKRVQDWLTLLGFELTAGTTLYYRPPVQHQGVTEHLTFMELMGRRWWPIFSGVYILAAKKRERGVRPIGLRQKWRMVPEVVRPITKGITRVR